MVNWDSSDIRLAVWCKVEEGSQDVPGCQATWYIWTWDWQGGVR